jgi:hypothetical protein
LLHLLCMRSNTRTVNFAASSPAALLTFRCKHMLHHDANDPMGSICLAELHSCTQRLKDTCTMCRIAQCVLHCLFTWILPGALKALISSLH